MLTTYNDQKFETFPSLNGTDSTTWHTVNLELSIPYVFITHCVEEELVWVFQTSIFWIEVDIINFCKDVYGNKLRKIDNVALLLPVEGGQSYFERHWVPVEEIWSVPNSSSIDARSVYLSASREWIGAGDGIGVDSTSAELLYRASETILPRKGR